MMMVVNNHWFSGKLHEKCKETILLEGPKLNNSLNHDYGRKGIVNGSEIRRENHLLDVFQSRGK